MKNIVLFFFTFTLSIVNAFSQDTLLWLKNNSGIIEDELGSVIRWENQILGYGNAFQSNSSLGAEQMQESYPGKVNVGFSRDGSYLELEDSEGFFSDNSFSVFYVGKVGDVSSVAGLFGNFKVNTSWNDCSGLRFVRKSNGDLAYQYGRPSYKHLVLNTLPTNEFFFFGFSQDQQGNYIYFDNSSNTLKTGTIDGEILHNADNHVINLMHQLGGSYTYDHTEVAELFILDDALSIDQIREIQLSLESNYPELVKSEFTLDEVLPSERTELLANSDLTLSFSQNIDESSSLPKVYINKNTIEATGKWSLTNNELIYKIDGEWPKGALVTVKLDENLLSEQGVQLDVASRSEYSFIVETIDNYGLEIFTFDAISTVNYPQIGHRLPLYLVLPEQRDKKVPVHFWVHGGGWSGGTAETSIASYSPHGTYLAEHLGVATLGISYRCKGSGGNYTLAMEDIDAAYQWALDNADVYNLDMTKVFFSGGSAGSPLASLTAQRYASTIGFIGFNGIYDFVNDQGSFGQWNGYGQEDPSAEANSAIFQLRNNPPATILMHGDEDTTIPYTQSTLFADKINSSGGEAITVIYPGQVHAFFNLGKEKYEDVLYEMVNFMTEVLNNEGVNTSVIAENIPTSTALKVFPNPVKEGGEIEVVFDSDLKKLDIEIVNMDGLIVLKTTLNVVKQSGLISLNSNALMAGTYILKLSGESILETRKIVVRK